MQSLTGSHIAQHLVKEKLGQGGMADVYKALHLRLNVSRAIKVIRPEFSNTPDFQARFEKEARLVASLRHPNIVQIHDFGEQDSLYYMVMEFVDGANLSHLVQQHGRIAISTATSIIVQVADALDAAHNKGMLHRDLKPENIMVNTDGLAILMDFGIARLVDNNTRLTQTGMSIGTPSYMAPEQALGEAELGPACDIYSLGVVLFELVTGQLPYQADTPIAVMMKALNDPMPMPRSLNPEIPEAFENIILKATAKQVEDRYADAAQFKQDLQGVLQHLETPTSQFRSDVKPQSKTAPTAEVPPDQSDISAPPDTADIDAETTQPQPIFGVATNT